MTPVYRTRPRTLREWLVRRLVGGTPFIANVTFDPAAVTAPASVLLGPGCAFELGYESLLGGEFDGLGEAINPGSASEIRGTEVRCQGSDARGEEGRRPDREARKWGEEGRRPDRDGRQRNHVRGR